MLRRPVIQRVTRMAGMIILLQQRMIGMTLITLEFPTLEFPTKSKYDVSKYDLAKYDLPKYDSKYRYLLFEWRRRSFEYIVPWLKLT